MIACILLNHFAHGTVLSLSTALISIIIDRKTFGGSVSARAPARSRYLPTYCCHRK